MKPNELRVGNWVNNNEEDYQITSATIAQLERGDSTAVPILLTEEWLLRFGLKKEEKSPSQNHGNYFSINIMDYKYSFAYADFRKDWGFYHSYTDAPKDEDNNRFDFISCGIKYVHQLQNLFYALSGNELEIYMND